MQFGGEDDEQLKDGVGHEEIESKYILEALKVAQGNKTKAADFLSLKRTTLIERLKRLDLEDF